MKKIMFISSLEQSLVKEVVANHRQRIEADGIYTAEEIEQACENILDCKVTDIEDSVDAELYHRVRKAAGYSN